MSALTRIKRIEAANRARIDAEFRAFWMRSLCAEVGVTEAAIVAATDDANAAMRRQGLDPSNPAAARRWLAAEGIAWSELEADAERMRDAFLASRADRRMTA